MSLRIMVDAGHGGHDPGACNLNLNLEEEDINLEIAMALGAILRERGHQVLYIRTGDIFTSPSQRLAHINKHEPDAFVSIHCNAGPVSACGIEVVYKDQFDKPLAEAIQSELVDKTGMQDRGTLRDGSPGYKRGLAVLKNLKVPAVIVEVGFITNEDDIEYVLSNVDTIALAIADGIKEWG